MIFNETKLPVVDNSGALTVKCFRIFKKSHGFIGDCLVVSVQTFRAGKKVKKGEVYKGIVVRTKFPLRRASGNYISFDKNGLVLWKRKEDSPVGTRVRSIVPLELRFLGYMKIILLAGITI